MGESASRKRAALRVLHEQWNVPLEALLEIGRYTETSLRGIAAREGWALGHSTASMQARLIEAFEKQMLRFSKDDGENTCGEQKARALSIMAKTLESIAVVGGRIATTRNLTLAGEQKQSGNKAADESKPPLDANRTADLDRQLAELVQNLT
ncbi:MAG: hypothetical protein V3V02_08320 [Rhizobiaceae bacterium]